MEREREIWKGVWETDDKPAKVPALRKYDKAGKVYPSSSKICHYWIRKCDEANKVYLSSTKICHYQIVKVCWGEKSEWRIMFTDQRMSENDFRKTSWTRWLINEGWVGLSRRQMKKPEQRMWSIFGEKTGSGKRGPGVRSTNEGDHYSFSIPTYSSPSQRFSSNSIASRKTLFLKDCCLQCALTELKVLIEHGSIRNRNRNISYSRALGTLGKTPPDVQGSFRKGELKIEIDDEDLTRLTKQSWCSKMWPRLYRTVIFIAWSLV